MTVEITDVADTTPRRAIASFDPYDDAQALLYRLADGGFPGRTLGRPGPGSLREGVGGRVHPRSQPAAAIKALRVSSGGVR